MKLDLFIILGWMVNEVVGEMEMVIFVKIEIASSIWRRATKQYYDHLYYFLLSLITFSRFCHRPSFDILDPGSQIHCTKPGTNRIQTEMWDVGNVSMYGMHPSVHGYVHFNTLHSPILRGVPIHTFLVQRLERTQCLRSC